MSENPNAQTYAFSEEQSTQLEAIRQVFNNFTGEEYTPKQFIHFFIETAIESQIKAAAEVSAKFNRSKAH